VLVGVDGKCRIAVTQPFTRHLDGYTRVDEQGPVGVADVMETDLMDSGAGDDPLEGL
jgi:hypothetical protein